MALNKSTNKTPSSRSGFFTELTASAKKQSNFLVPVRIKATPSKQAPLSDGKKNIGKMMKPVLIKDLFPSSKKDRRNTIAISATSHKKRVSEVSEPFLNTQSCYKPKKEDDKPTFFNRKSNENSKVRRQLYQSPTRADKSKKNNIKTVPKKEKIMTDSSTEIPRTSNFRGKENESNLLPRNSIKNNYIRRSGSIFKPPSQQYVKQKQNHKNIGSVSQAEKIKFNTKNNHAEKDVPVLNNSFYTDDSSKESSYLMKDVSTMTSPFGTITADGSLSNLHELDRPSVIMSPSKIKFQDSVIKVTELQKQETNISHADLNNMNATFQNMSLDLKNITDADLKHFVNIKYFLDQSLKACENQAHSLEQSLQACKNQVSNIKQTLYFVNNIIISKSITTTELDVKIPNRICDQSDIFVNRENNLGTKNFEKNSITEEKLFEKNNTYEKTKISPTKNEENIEIYKEPPKVFISFEDSNQVSETEVSENILKPVELSTIGEVSCESVESRKDDQSSLDNKDLISSCQETLKSSTISEKDNYLNLENKDLNNSNSNTCESLIKLSNNTCLETQENLDNSLQIKGVCSSLKNKSLENKENLENLFQTTTNNTSFVKLSKDMISENENLNNPVHQTVTRKSLIKTPKRKNRKSITSENTNPPNLRRSLRLVEKSLSIDSLSESTKDDSFTLLENELNVKHEMCPPQSKSVPVSPSKVPLTPGTVRQWDKRVQRPLKEYMALKMNGTFLVTPDAKRFQSVLEPTDTPHSRKSLSRKIFMELCDLYAESPEHN